ncbi:MAG: hypothetical protein NTX03_15160 [Bacteroidetes bacterium]|nr:hypothetical protein [Bacteroidota bacterium]
MDSIIYDGKVCKLLSYQAVKLTGYGFCDEEIDFRGIGKISLPGFSSRKPLCNWQLKNDSLQIMNTDTFDFVYNGMYQVEFSGGLILKSKKTTIYCHAEVHDYYYLFRH